MAPLDKVTIIQTRDTFGMSTAEANQWGLSQIDISELGLAMLLVKLCGKDPQFIELIRKILIEAKPVKGPLDTIDDLHRITYLETAIRKHRDARGHDRCWENDQELYRALPETVPDSPQLPPEPEFMANCKLYYEQQSRVKPVTCRSCNDTHSMTVDGESFMCTNCPTPCPKCRGESGRSPYCTTTPCPCTCHKNGR